LYIGGFQLDKDYGGKEAIELGVEWSEDIRMFNAFMENVNLVDLPLLRRKYTRVQPDEICMRRLDRVLVDLPLL
jgi:hypothetical protein